jgi:hypothetical protein
MIDLTEAENQQRQFEQPLRSPACAIGRFCFKEDDANKTKSPDSTPRRNDLALSSWDQIPENMTMSDEGLSTQEEHETWTSEQGPFDLCRGDWTKMSKT